MKKYTIIGAVMTLAIVCTFVVIGSVYANDFDRNNGRHGGPKSGMTDEMKAVHEQINAAIQNNDYETWKSLVAGMPNAAKMSEKITADNFSKFAEAHQLMNEAHAKMEEARIIMNELGMEGALKSQFNCGKGAGMNHMKFMKRPDFTEQE